MSTDPANHDLSAYLDGELSAEERVRVEAALDADPALQAELDSLRQVSAMLRRHGPVDAPFGFKARVLEAVADEPAPSVSWWARLRRPFGIPIEAVAVATAALLVALVVTTGDEPAQVVDSPGFEAPASSSDQVLAPTGRDGGAAAAVIRAPAVAPSANGSEAVARSTEQRALTETVSATRVDSVTAPAPEPMAEGEAEPSPTPSASPDAPTARPDAAVQPVGTSEDADAPALFGASYRYRVSSAAPDSVARLLRLAGRYEGRVVDAEGHVVTEGTDLTSPRSLRVQIPARHLAAFGDALRALGLVNETPDDRIFASSQVSIQVDLVP